MVLARAARQHARPARPPSAERCFRTDWTGTTSALVDAGTISSQGQVVIELTPGSDALSGVAGHMLLLGPALAPNATDGSNFYWAGSIITLVPLVTFVGEGDWLGWVRVVDRANNDNHLTFGDQLLRITVNADSALPRPAPPRFLDSAVNTYGSVLEWDAGVPGATHFVASFCNLDAGCGWRHAFQGVPASIEPGQWIQLEDEGPVVARVAAVVSGRVGPWSAPSAPLLVDRTPPPGPGPLIVTPAAARQGPISLRWSVVTDDFTGLSGTVITEEDDTGATRELNAAAPAVSLQVSPPREGRFLYRASSLDVVGNQSGWTSDAVVVIDATGPVSLPPGASATVIDGGAMVMLAWATPTDALSAVTSLELQESAVDGGATIFAVTGLLTQRFVPPGTWTWRLRATDALGNVGAFSLPSNVVTVSGGGVGVGPSIDASRPIGAHCGVPLSVTLPGAGDPPLTWALVSGPAGAAVSATGRLTWTPPAQLSGAEQVSVSLTNAVGTVSATFTVAVSCSSDGGSTTDAGSESIDAGADADAGVDPRALRVGCGCSFTDPTVVVVAVATALLRRRRA